MMCRVVVRCALFRLEEDMTLTGARGLKDEESKCIHSRGLTTTNQKSAPRALLCEHHQCIILPCHHLLVVATYKDDGAVGARLFDGRPKCLMF